MRASRNRRLAAFASHLGAVHAHDQDDQQLAQLRAELEKLTAEQNRVQLRLAAIYQQHPPDWDSASKDQLLDFFRVNGYCVVPRAVDSADLARVQKAWLAAAVPARKFWEAEKAKGHGKRGLNFDSGTWVARTYFDMPRFIEGDGSFVGLIDNPRVLPLIKATMRRTKFREKSGTKFNLVLRAGPGTRVPKFSPPPP
eukprot:SAG31_NODE_13530_length_863_cov_1.497382_1_plen_196_part_10